MMCAEPCMRMGLKSHFLQHATHTMGLALCGEALNVIGAKPKKPTLGLNQVFVAQYGCKMPAPVFEACFDLGAKMHPSFAFDVGYQLRDPDYVWLFGLPEAGPQVFDLVPGMACQAYIHRILPGMVAPEDSYTWGTLELRPVGGGRAGGEPGKLIQAYSSRQLPSHDEGIKGKEGWGNQT